MSCESVRIETRYDLTQNILTQLLIFFNKQDQDFRIVLTHFSNGFGRMHVLWLTALFGIEHPDDGRVTTETRRYE
jgi:hypothetical protein